MRLKIYICLNIESEMTDIIEMIKVKYVVSNERLMGVNRGLVECWWVNAYKASVLKHALLILRSRPDRRLVGHCYAFTAQYY